LKLKQNERQTQLKPCEKEAKFEPANAKKTQDVYGIDKGLPWKSRTLKVNIMVYTQANSVYILCLKLWPMPFVC